MIYVFNKYDFLSESGKVCAPRTIFGSIRLVSCSMAYMTHRLLSNESENKRYYSLPVATAFLRFFRGFFFIHLFIRLFFIDFFIYKIAGNSFRVLKDLEDFLLSNVSGNNDR